jgi:hypothetical protein
MRRVVHTILALGLLFGLAFASSAADDEAGIIIDKAIKAHGFKSGPKKEFAYRGKNKGTLSVAGLNLEIEQEVAVQTPNKFKEVVRLSIMGQNIVVTTVFNGKEAWIKQNDKDIPVNGDIMAELKEAAYGMRLSQGLFLKDKSLKLSLLGEVQVNGKPAVGIKVEKKGQKDMDFYFDKGTGLLAKVQRRAKELQGAQAGQEVTEERFITEYQEVKGRKIAKKVEIKRDGKDFLKVEAIESELPEMIDDSEFAKP